MWIGCKRRIGAGEEELLFSLESMQDVMTTFRSRIAIAVLIDFVDFWWISFLSKWLIEFVLENPLFKRKTIFWPLVRWIIIYCWVRGDHCSKFFVWLIWPIHVQWDTPVSLACLLKMCSRVEKLCFYELANEIREVAGTSTIGYWAAKIIDLIGKMLFRHFCVHWIPWYCILFLMTAAYNWKSFWNNAVIDLNFRMLHGKTKTDWTSFTLLSWWYHCENITKIVKYQFDPLG